MTWGRGTIDTGELGQPDSSRGRLNSLGKAQAAGSLEAASHTKPEQEHWEGYREQRSTRTASSLHCCQA